MNLNNTLSSILTDVRSGNLSCLTGDNIKIINDTAVSLLEMNVYTDADLEAMGYIIYISNILYENTSRLVLPLDDGVYDLLYEVYKKYVPNFKIGAELVQFNTDRIANDISDYADSKSDIIDFVDISKRNSMLYYQNISSANSTNLDMIARPMEKLDDIRISKRTVESGLKHEYPKLVGTLDKCKFVLYKQAEDKNAADDPKVKILERDFFGDHIAKGILNPNRKIRVLAELKYDGVSVEATCSDRIISARTRGDTAEDNAADLTPIFADYIFPYASKLKNDTVGVKFEAIMTNVDLYYFNLARGKNYKNCRTAIIGLIGSSDAYKYRDYITLVPLSTSLDIEPDIEVLFMNEMYARKEKMRYAILEGTIVEILYQIKVFVDEAEYLRPFMPFMYDGVVISYLDDDIIDRLGRVNSINKYSMAIKFNPLKKLTTFRGYTYSVGQDGSITPMIHFDPVEFFGTIHPKTTGHSYKRFRELNLKMNDVIEAEYVNDVIVYVSKPDNRYNYNNPNPIIEFPTVCPSCGQPITISASNKTAYCTNMDCPERLIARLANMMDKLNLKDFAEESLIKIGKYSLTELLKLTEDDIAFLGKTNAKKFVDRMSELWKPIYDYKLVGALGFQGIAIETWKKILNAVSLKEILCMQDDELYATLISIKGIGKLTVDTILEQYRYFFTDLVTISSMPNVIQSKGEAKKLSIRVTGFRNPELISKLCEMGYDASETAGVTKTTDILLIPAPGHSSSKTAKAGANTKIVPVAEFMTNMGKYLQ